MRLKAIVILISLSTIMLSCGEDEKEKITEGVIEFEVTYPYFEGRPLTKSLLPDEMIVKFKDDRLISKVSKSRMISTIIIANGKTEELSTGLDFGTEKIITDLNAKDLDYLRSRHPEIKIEYTDETDSIAGFLCKKAIGKFTKEDKPDIEVYYTEDIKIENGNFFTPFKEINGVLLAYDIEHYGVRMRVEAQNFYAEEVDDEEFEVEKKFNYLKFSEFDARMNELFDKLMN